MSTKLYDEDFSINEFYGGFYREQCIQITDNHGYVQLDKEQVKKLVEVLQQWLSS